MCRWTFMATIVVATAANSLGSTHKAMGFADILKQADVGFAGTVAAIREEQVPAG